MFMKCGMKRYMFFLLGGITSSSSAEPLFSIQPLLLFDLRSPRLKKLMFTKSPPFHHLLFQRPEHHLYQRQHHCKYQR